MPTIIHRHRRTLLRLLAIVAAVTYAATTISGMREGSRLSAFLLAGTVAAIVGNRSHMERRAGTCMVLVLAVFLVLEGASRAHIEELGETAFLEMTLGIYLTTASWLLLRRPDLRL